MKKSTVLTAAFFCAAAFASCSKSDTPGDTPVTQEGGPVQVTVKLVQPGPATYAISGDEPGTAAESEVKQIELYVFNSDGSVDTKVGSQNGYATFNPSDQSNLGTTLVISSGTSKKFVTVVNMNLGAVANYAALKNKLATGAFAANSTDGYLSRDETRGGKGLEMTGEVVQNIVDGIGNNQVYIAVNRLATKIYAPTYLADQSTGTGKTSVNITDAQIAKLWEVEIGDGTVENVLGTGVSITNGIIEFKADGYAVINGFSRSDAFFIGNASGNDQAAWDDWSDASKDGSSTPKKRLTSTFTAVTDVTDPTYGQYTSNYSGPQGLAADFTPVAGEENGYFLDGSSSKKADRVYVYENKGEIYTNAAGASGYRPSTVYSFIIKGTLTITGDTNGELTKVRYWRINLIKDDNYRVFRNTAYRINVKTITSIGKGTPKEAEDEENVIPGPNETAAEIQVQVSPWRLYEFETEM